jgi:LPS-assembly protein
VQQPDSFLEGTYTGEDYVLSAFTRVHPNRYHRVQERLPEIRFDLLPSATPAAGLYERGSASFAVLDEDAFLNLPGQRSTRLDAYYGLERPIALAPWMTFTPVAGGRITHYADATNGKDAYTRVIGEVGFDARLRAAGVFDYKNPLWEIDGLRHLVEPRLSYRYAPDADSGRRYIPAIDRRVFSTYLQPLSIADQRNIDDLSALNTVRLSLNNTLQTRGPAGGSRDLATLDFAADYRFTRTAPQRPLTDIHTELSLMPAPWLRFSLYERFTPQTSEQQELNYALEISDQEWWAARLSSHFLRDDYQEYALDYRQRVNEVFDLVGRWRYDVRHSRFNEQTYGVSQRLGQTWAIKYEVSFSEGSRRESNFGFNVEVELLKF